MNAWIEHEGHKVTVSGRIFVGRHPKCDLVLEHPSVSRRHAMLYEENGKYILADLGSRNGVTRDGVIVTSPITLRDKDKIGIGRVLLSFRWPAQPKGRAAATTGLMATMTLNKRAAALHRQIVMLDAELQVIRPSREWLALVNRFFRATPDPYTGLVPRLEAWIQRTATALDTGDPNLTEPLAAQDGAARLICRVERGPQGALVLIATEEAAAFDITSLKTLGLSPREAEVMHWIAQGKTNTDIGALLNLSVSTINKHVEHILAKLGVENRQQAILEVIERLGRG